MLVLDNERLELKDKAAAETQSYILAKTYNTIHKVCNELNLLIVY